MIIQCTSCHTKYRLNLETLPNHKTFVKCRHCGTPIFLETAPPAAKSQPTPAGFGAPPQATAFQTSTSQTPGDTEIVACERCGTRYRVPAHVLHGGAAKLKCTRCAHVFAPPQTHSPAAAAQKAPGLGPIIPPQAVGQSRPPVSPPPRQAPGEDLRVIPPHFYPPPASGQEPPEAKGKTMPLPDESRMSALFDDLQGESARPASPTGYPKPHPQGFGLGPDFGPEAQHDPEQAYLEAISLEDETGQMEPLTEPNLAPVPPTQRYRFFLNPKVSKGQQVKPPPDKAAPQAPPQPAAQSKPPPVEEELVLDRMAHLRDESPPPREDKRGKASPKHDPEADHFPSPEAWEQDHSAKTRPGWEDDIPSPEQFVASQGPGFSLGKNLGHGQRWPGANLRAAITASLVALLLAGGSGWAWALHQGLLGGKRFHTLPANQMALTFSQPPSGRFVANIPSRNRLYVIAGVVKNDRKDETVGLLKIRGVALQNNQPLGDAVAFAGNLLTDQELANWDLGAIRAFHGYPSGRRDANLAVHGGGEIPFQIVIPNLDGTVTSAQAEMISFAIQDKMVYVHPPKR